MVTLYQRSKTGKVKFIKLWTDGAHLCSEWGTTDSDKPQTTRKECEAKNTGRSNATTAAEQAILEMEAKIKKKKENGYREKLDDINETAVVDITLDNLPKEFCPCKPINKAPKKILDDKDTYGQQKRDGHCIILVKTESGRELVYSRGMEDITEYMSVIPEVKQFVGGLLNGTMVLTEFCFVKPNGKDSTREVAKLVRKKDRDEVLKRYNEANTRGKFEIAPFDVMYYQCEFLGDLTYKKRFGIMHNLMLLSNVPPIWFDWKNEINQAKEKDWEGFILRNDSNSKIHYSLNGKADKAGSYKYVFTREDDFIVTGAEKGKAGKQTGLYAQFNLVQIMENGEHIDCGNCGPGKLKHDRLAELTKEIDSGELTFPFAIQVEYRDRQPDTGKLTFPQFCEVRYDKKPEECTTDFVPE